MYGTAYSGGASNQGTVFKLNRDGAGYSVLWNFAGTNGDGGQPSAGLIRATNGALYGTTYGGGSSNFGTVFRLNQDGTGYVVIKSFSGDDGANPYAALVQATNGMLYGTTYNGGASNLGVVFSMALDGSAYTVLKNFTGISGDGAHPRAALLQARDGAFYGTTQIGGDIGNGTVFTLETDGGGYAVIRSFQAALGEGAEPYGALIQGTNGALYGTTLHGGLIAQGTVFKLNTDGSGYAVVKFFHGIQGDGANPYAALVLGTNGVLYGTLWTGGSNDLGAVFRVNPDGSNFKLLKQFNVADGTSPRASLLLATDGLLYGTTDAGGSGASGSVFKLNPDGSGFVQLRSFAGLASDAINPYSGLVQGSNGMLYGTAYSGGSAGVGAVFRLRPDGSDYSLLKTFTGANGDGANPYASMVVGTSGVLYGTTFYGGASSAGTVFSLNPDGSGFRVLKSFSYSTDGGLLYAPLCLAGNGVLYGAAYYGGSKSFGILFRLNPDGSGFSVLRSFTGTNGDGGYPVGGLVQGTNGALYGTTYYGGATNNYGTVFMLSPDGSAYTVLKRFAGGDGAYPYAALVQGQDGGIYGTTVAGGSFGRGTVFRFNPDGSGYTTILNFGRSNADAANPYAALVQGPSGVFYGTTRSGGAFSQGAVFQLNADGSGYAVLKSFAGSGSDGAFPESPLLFGTDGTLYGTTESGGALGFGTVFNLVPPAFLLRPEPVSGGFVVRFDGVPGRTYTVQRASSTLGPWAALTTITVGPAGVAQFADNQAPPGRAFYRTTYP